jgi:uncharacterized protein
MNDRAAELIASRVAFDEVWHFCEGEPLELLVIDPEFSGLTRAVLGPHGDDSSPVHVVPAGSWQSAQPKGSYTLVGCTVGTGFEFEDFRMLRDLPQEAARLAERFPELTPLL